MALHARRQPRLRYRSGTYNGFSYTAREDGRTTQNQKHPPAHLPVRRPNETKVLTEGRRTRFVGIPEASPGRTRVDQSRRLHLPHQSKLPSRLRTRTDRRGVSRGDLVSLRDTGRARTNHSRTLDRGEAGSGVCLFPKSQMIHGP